MDTRNDCGLTLIPSLCKNDCSHYKVTVRQIALMYKVYKNYSTMGTSTQFY